MNFSNWIELGILVVLLISGITVKMKTKKRVKELDGFSGIVKQEKHKGKVFSKM